MNLQTVKLITFLINIITGKNPCSNSSCPLTFFSDKNRETHEIRAHKPITAGTMYR